MTNLDLIREYISGSESHNACNHSGYNGDTFVNYRTVLCEIDRVAKTAKLNKRKYSVTTSKIQSYLARELEMAGYKILEVEGADDYICLVPTSWRYCKRDFA